MMLLISFTACTQSQERARDGRGGNFDSSEMIERQVDRISEALELNDGQKQQVTEVFKESDEKRREMRDELRGDREAMREAMQEIGQEREKSLKSILTPDQWTKWTEIRGEFQQRRQRRGGGNND